MNRLLGFLAVLFLVMRPATAATPTCTKVYPKVLPCLSYLKLVTSDEGDGPSPACCAGVKDLYNEAKSKPDRVAICECIKDALSKVGPYNPEKIHEIPKKCGIPIDLPPMHANFDCSKVA
ncbi:hypothetical protein Acr_08g0007550 [Actinidia rufa]|uniref:Non-specific lipid-transfer protein n=1 Tax=Actinidia rufa TaxID=165716 RepID=A0A7J0F2D6_9ERIC|nr:hypothetical protein Acr_08g0007550 [Actinidia rufa]